MSQVDARSEARQLGDELLAFMGRAELDKQLLDGRNYSEAEWKEAGKTLGALVALVERLEQTVAEAAMLRGATDAPTFERIVDLEARLAAVEVDRDGWMVTADRLTRELSELGMSYRRRGDLLDSLAAGVAAAWDALEPIAQDSMDSTVEEIRNRTDDGEITIAFQTFFAALDALGACAPVVEEAETA